MVKHWSLALLLALGSGAVRPVMAQEGTSPVSSMPARRALEVETGFAYESLDNGFADWRSHYLSARQPLGERGVLYGTLRETNRFDREDQELLLGLSRPWGRRGTAIVEASASPSHRVLPQWSMLAQVQRALANVWGAQLGLRHSDYERSRLSLGMLTLERYWGDYRAAYTLYSAHPDGGGAALSHALTTSYYYGADSRINLVLAVGKEVESEGSAGLLSSDVRGVALFGSHGVGRRWAITYTAGAHRQGSRYRRKGLQLGVLRRF